MLDIRFQYLTETDLKILKNAHWHPPQTYTVKKSTYNLIPQKLNYSHPSLTEILKHE